jgi:hypothetical protein
MAAYVLNVTYNNWLKNIGFTEELVDRTEIQNVDVHAWNTLRKQTTFSVLGNENAD